MIGSTNIKRHEAVGAVRCKMEPKLSVTGSDAYNAASNFEVTFGLFRT